MSNETIRQLKKKVEEEERLAKSKRKLPPQSEPKNKVNKSQKASLEDPSSQNGKPLKVTSSSKVDEILNSNIFQKHDDLLQRSQTPIASNLLRLTNSRQSSPQFQPTSPFTTVQPLSPSQWEVSPHDKMFEYSSFFESNLRQNSRRASNRLTPLDDDENAEIPLHDIDQIQDQQHQQLVLSENFHDLAIPTPSTFTDPLEGLDPFNFEILQNPNPNAVHLDSVGSHLYDYYVNRLSGIVSIVPPKSNYYLKFFLPMAAENPGILNSILAWSAFHIGGAYEEEGTKYMSKALDYVQKTSASTDSETLQRLANLLIMAAAEICKGDVKKWPFLLEWASKIIKKRGGLFNFKKNTEQHWLISNFAYHDILTSSSSERGTYFPVEDYENFMVNFGSGIDPLQGIVKPVFNIIGEISTLAFETKRLLKITSNSLGYGILDEENGHNMGQDDGDKAEEDDDDEEEDDDLYEVPGIDTPESERGKKVSRYTSLLTIMSRSSDLENKINNVKPDPEDLANFEPYDLELQLTLFELFQLTAKLHLRQSVLKLNPSSLETQFILCELLKCLDIVLRSSVEGSLCFPLFIAGMNCTTRRDRKMMLERFNDIIQRYSFKNLERARTVMEQVWLIGPSGTRCVDWYEIVKKLNWDLSFA
jgi:transcriptional activator protein UGA3